MNVPRFTLALALVVGLVLVLANAGAARADSIWTPVDSGTTDAISSIVYQSPSRFWYATTNGELAYWDGGAFLDGLNDPGENFTDLAFQPISVPGGPGTPGLVGYAVTGTGHVWRTTDGGVSWAQLSSPSTRQDCSPGSPTLPESELNAVVWSSSSTVYLLGNDSTLEKSTNAASQNPTFTEINKVGTGTCAAQGSSDVENLTDATFLAANDGFMVDQNLGTLFQTTDGFGSGIIRTGTVANASGNPRIAQDAGNPNRLWVVDHGSGGSGCGVQCLQYTTDGGLTHTSATFANDVGPTVGLYGVSSEGGVEVTAGSGGEIFTSTDGSTFYLRRAGNSLTSENWRAEAAFDPAHAAVGGEGGALATTSQANTVPDIIAPTGRITGPKTARAGKKATYTAEVTDNPGGSGIDPASLNWNVPGFPTRHGSSASYRFPRSADSETVTLTFTDNAGNQGTARLHVTVRQPPPSGSHPRTITIGGARVKTYGVVTVSGRNGRFVPLHVSTNAGRRFAVTIESAIGRHRRVTSKSTLRHAGSKAIHARLPRAAKPGKYFIIVRVSTLSGVPLGQLKLRFKLV